MSLTISRTIDRQNPYRLCFVCLGNICRSPTAEGIFRHLLNEHALQKYVEVDSAGTSAYHTGEAADRRAQKTAQHHNMALHSKSRKLTADDLSRFDLLLAMDTGNQKDINALADAHSTAQVMLMRDFDPHPENGEVPDPYKGGPRGFERVFQTLHRSCTGLLEAIQPHINSE